MKTCEQDNLELTPYEFFIGLDEVGRGPLAGPVVACAALFTGNSERFKSLSLKLEKMGVTDSKKLKAKKREKILFDLGFTTEGLRPNRILIGKVGEEEIYFSLAEVSPERIDEINILQASLEAMSQCLMNLRMQIKKSQSGFVFIDGNKIPKIDSELESHLTLKSFVKGDLHHPIIGVASIMAKEYRDYLMNLMSKNFPQYGFEVHSGYPTAAHLSSIKFFGPCLHHRKTFKGVKEFVENEAESRAKLFS